MHFPRQISRFGIFLEFTSSVKSEMSQKSTMLDMLKMILLVSLVSTVESIPDCTQEHLGGVEAVLLDLDGTIYGETGTLPKAAEFVYALGESEKLWKFFTNGSKSPDYTRNKLWNLGIRANLEDIYSASTAVCDFMNDHLPDNAMVYVLVSHVVFHDKYFTGLKFLDQVDRTCQGMYPMKWAQWKITYTFAENRVMRNVPSVLEWALAAKMDPKRVWIMNTSEGEIRDKLNNSYSGWNFEIIQNVNFLLSNGANMIISGPDCHSWKQSAEDLTYPELNHNSISNGCLVDMFKRSSELEEGKNFFCVGKGGHACLEYFAKPAFLKLKAEKETSTQSPLRSKNPLTKSQVVVIGDNFSTDIHVAGVTGFKSVLIEHGLHRRDEADKYAYKPDCAVKSFDQLATALGMPDLDRELTMKMVKEVATKKKELLASVNPNREDCISSDLIWISTV